MPLPATFYLLITQTTIVALLMFTHSIRAKVQKNAYQRYHFIPSPKKGNFAVHKRFVQLSTQILKLRIIPTIVESLPFIEWCLDNLNYFTIFILMIIESSFIPFPSEIVIPPAAYIAASSGEMHLGLIVLFGTLGAMVGALINYGLAVWLGRPIIYRFASSKIGAFFLLDRDKIGEAERFFVKHGAIATFTGRLVPGIRQLISIPAGLARMPMLPFLLYTALGAGSWNLVLVLLGWYLERVVPRDQLNEYVSRYSHEIGLVIIAIVAIALAVMIYKASKRPKTDVTGTNTPNE